MPVTGRTADAASLFFQTKNFFLKGFDCMKNYRTLTTIGVLTAASILLSLVELPIIPPPFTFLKLDFADVPVILACLLMGPLPALVISLVRNIIGIFTTSTMGIGSVANFMMAALYVLVFYLISRKNKDNKRLIVAMASASGVNIAASVVLNFAVFIPLYQLVGMYPNGVSPIYYIAAGLLPLNLVKWPVLSVVSFLLSKPLRSYVTWMK